MKKHLFTLLLLNVVFSLNVFSQNSSSGAVLKFDIPEYDYGKIDIENIPDAKLDIKFSNTGSAPLIISNVRGCCGSRIIDWTKEPILPGKSGIVKIHFEIPQKIQTISRTVTIISNSTNSPDIFKIKGEVVEKDNSIIKK